jgi:hypothetical protein
MSILGNRVLRTEDPKFLTTGGSYVDDIILPGAAWVAYVRSPFAHARIRSIGTGMALDAAGVLEVLTAEDLVDVAPMGSPFGEVPPAMARPLLGAGTVRFVGEPVAAVVAGTRAQAMDATELVEVEYDPMPAVVTPEAALGGETLLFPEMGTNVAFEFGGALDGSLFGSCEVVVSQAVVNQRLAPCPLEVRAAATSWGDDGRLTHPGGGEENRTPEPLACHAVSWMSTRSCCLLCVGRRGALSPHETLAEQGVVGPACQSPSRLGCPVVMRSPGTRPGGLATLLATFFRGDSDRSCPCPAAGGRSQRPSSRERSRERSHPGAPCR